MYDYNATRPGETEKRLELLGRIFAEVGEGCWIEPPLRANWGTHTHLGNHVYANFNLTLVDDTQVTIGDYVMIGPNTLITTVNHPLSPAGRRRHLGQARPVAIGRDVWIGGNCTILPGVTIGNNAVIAAGAVVTKDVPDNCVVAGVPARKIKDISDDTEGMET